MKKLSEPGQGTKPPQKKKRQLRTLIVWAGIANSTREAQEMLAAGEICVSGHDHGWPVNVLGQRIFSDPTQYGRTMFDEDTQVAHCSRCPKCSRRPIAFVKKDKKAAISSTTHSRVLVGDDSDDDERNLPGEVQRKEDLF